MRRVFPFELDDIAFQRVRQDRLGRDVVPVEGLPLRDLCRGGLVDDAEDLGGRDRPRAREDLLQHRQAEVMVGVPVGDVEVVRRFPVS